MKDSKGEFFDANNPVPKALAQWRQLERARILKLRSELSLATRQDMDQAIGEKLDTVLGDVHGRVCSLYWPFRGEPDLLQWMGTLVLRGGIVALPVVIQKKQPLAFYTWSPGEKLEPGIWNIPVPVDGSAVIPSVVIAPLVGFDQALFRLGYGGGFFDRTLASFPHKPLVIGVGYELGRLVTIFPQPYDIPMDIIITPDDIYRPEAGITDKSIRNP